ncbi:hypothetical protein GIB67_029539 [Kingdonia uniflora]|uniref:Uncharacterized protein n=1 Tax=Kingdonia uniflora TaxID=39325 RepID=A0A7J7NY29_9MAGN|nr:hypothetical protein GIB67_029539 [Kingdonia uniflora]
MLVHHNLSLRDCESNAKEEDGNSDDMIDPMDDWNVDEAVTPQSSIDSVAWMDSNTIGNVEEPSKIQPKKEQQQSLQMPTKVEKKKYEIYKKPLSSD